MKTRTAKATDRNYTPKDDLIKATLAKIVDDFVSGNITDKLVEISKIKDDRPCAKWSWWNKLIMTTNHTDDARGYNQWKDAGRTVKAGARAFYIAVPYFKTRKETDPDTGLEEEVKYLKGFIDGAVFRVEDTEGADLPKLEPVEPPPLREVAEKFGVTVAYAGLVGAYGSTNGTDKITLASHDVSVFFHELAHIAHGRILKADTGHGLKGGQDPIQECAAEMAAGVLCRMYLPDNYDRLVYDYVAGYSRLAGEEPATMVMKIVNVVEKIVRDIINGKN